jgi:hypothetical protein
MYWIWYCTLVLLGPYSCEDQFSSIYNDHVASQTVWGNVSEEFTILTTTFTRSKEWAGQIL